MKRHTSHRYGIKRRKNRKGSSLPLLYLEFFFSLGNTLFFSLISPFRQTRISPPSSCLPVSPFLHWHGSLVCSPSFLRGRKEGKVCGIRQPNNSLHVTSYNACKKAKISLERCFAFVFSVRIELLHTQVRTGDLAWQKPGQPSSSSHRTMS